MIRYDDASMGELMGIVGREIESEDHDLAYQDDRFLLCLANDLRHCLSRDER
jgi:hypothetical protein